MLQIDGQHRVGECRLEIVVEPTGAGPGVMPHRAQEADGTPALGPGDLRKVLEQPHHGGEPRGIVRGRLEVPVHMRDDENFLIAHPRKCAPYASRPEPGNHLATHPQVNRDSLAPPEQVTQHQTVLVSEVEAGPTRDPLPDGKVIRDSVHDSHRSRPVFEGSSNRPLGSNRVPERSRPRNIQNQHCLSANIAPEVVGLATGRDPHQLEIEPAHRRRFSALRGSSRFQLERSATCAEADGPTLGLPLRSHVEGLPVYVLEAVRAEVSLDPVLRLLVAERAYVPSPENVSAVPIGERNRVDLHEEPLQPISIDVRILLVVGPQRDPNEGIIPNVAGRVEEGLAQRIRGVLSG